MPAPLIKILVIEEKSKQSKILSDLLLHSGCHVDQASNGYSALNYVSYEQYQALFISTTLPLLKTKDLIPRLIKLQPSAKMILVGDPGSADLPNTNGILATINSIEEWGSIPQLVQKISSPLSPLTPLKGAESKAGKESKPGKESQIIGQGLAMKKYFSVLEKIVKSTVTVLIQGGSGTGKELTARALHDGGPRASNRLVIVNCSAIPENLLESELFGHEKGAFTGAVERRIGRFELANQGTIFLDEIGELPLSIQAKFLRVLEEQAFERVGGNETLHVDVRIVSATNRNLKDMVAQSLFREDLYYRLSAIPIYVPYLRERKEDIPDLVKYFLQKYLHKTGKPGAIRIHPEALARLQTYEWPGNVRELENVVMRAMVMCEGEVIEAKDLPSEISETKETRVETPHSGDGYLRRAGPLEALEKEAIEKALAECSHNASRAAQLLNIGRMTFYRKAKQYAVKLREAL